MQFQDPFGQIPGPEIAANNKPKHEIEVMSKSYIEWNYHILEKEEKKRALIH
jgi:hypothetical protein